MAENTPRRARERTTAAATATPHTRAAGRLGRALVLLLVLCAPTCPSPAASRSAATHLSSPSHPSPQTTDKSTKPPSNRRRNDAPPPKTTTPRPNNKTTQTTKQHNKTKPNEQTTNRLHALNEYIEDTEDLVNLKLDQHRNELIGVDLVLTAMSLCMAMMTAVAGYFGMVRGWMDGWCCCDCSFRPRFDWFVYPPSWIAERR